MTGKRKTVKNEDQEQSRRFLETARELEAGGDQSPTEIAEEFNRIARRVLPEVRRPTKS